MTKPVHVSIRDDLRLRIAAGEWAAGDRLPSETDLAARYGVARMTVRQAVGALAGEGVVVRRQGLGTFAAERPPARRVGALLSFTEEMRSQGRDVETKVIKAAVEQPPDQAREALQLAACAAAVTVQRVRIVDECPIVVQHSWLPCARFAGLDAEPLIKGSMYATIEGRYGVRIMRARQVFRATVACESEAELLELELGSPVLRITRTTYDGANRPVEFAMSAMRPGSPVETMMERASARPRRERAPAGR
jgi:GntR family transcriptional regulator